jgi:hypothetical protein
LFYFILFIFGCVIAQLNDVLLDAIAAVGVMFKVFATAEAVSEGLIAPFFPVRARQYQTQHVRHNFPFALHCFVLFCFVFFAFLLFSFFGWLFPRWCGVFCEWSVCGWLL